MVVELQSDFFVLFRCQTFFVRTTPQTKHAEPYFNYYVTNY